MLIMNGTITSPNQIAGKVDSWDLQCLAGAMQIENGDNSEECIFLQLFKSENLIPIKKN